MDDYNGFSIEFGTLNLDARGTKTTLQDDSASVGSMGFQKPMDFTNTPNDNSIDVSDCSVATTASQKMLCTQDKTLITTTSQHPLTPTGGTKNSGEREVVGVSFSGKVNTVVDAIHSDSKQESTGSKP